MSKSPLLLSSDGLYCPTQKEQEKEQRVTWKLSSSLCLVARDCYWEHIAYYPTSNVLEVYKIIASEIDQISPLPGKISAFIVNLSNNKATVLYCNFSPELLSLAEQYKLWRLIPETLPLYRSLFKENKVYHTSVNYAPLNIAGDMGVNSAHAFQNQMILKVNPNRLASLPYNNHSNIPFASDTTNATTTIDSTLYSEIIGRFRLLDSLDFVSQGSDRLKQFFNNGKHLSAVMTLFFASLLISFILGKSAYLIWQHDTLSSEIAVSKSEASRSVQLLNSLKQTRQDIEAINLKLNEQKPKAQILNVLSSIPSETNELLFKTIDVSPASIRIQGTVKSSAELLSELSEIEGFSEVKFNHPPSTIRKKGERFNINISYDSRIYAAGVKNDSE